MVDEVKEPKIKDVKENTVVNPDLRNSRLVARRRVLRTQQRGKH